MVPGTESLGSTVNHGRQLIVLAAVVVGSLVLAAAADAKSKEASFRVEVYAAQNSAWTQDTTRYDECTGGDVRTHGSGRESFSATTRKPVKVTASYSKGEGYQSVFFTVGKGDFFVPVNGAAVREGTKTVEQTGSKDCAGGGDGYVPPPTDCGERSFDGGLSLDYYFPTDYPGFDVVPLVPVLGLSGPFDLFGAGPILGDLYENCPHGAFGDQLVLTPRGDLSVKQLFGEKERFAVKVKDSQVVDEPSSGFHEEIQLSWRVKFTRRPAPK